MKTLAQISLTVLIVAMAVTSNAANSYRTFRMQIANDLEILVISKQENIVDEYLPIVPNVLSRIPALSVHLKKEELAALQLTKIKKNTSITDEEVIELVHSMHREEEEVTETFEFDTHIIFEECRYEKRFELTTEILSAFIKEEKEVAEDIYFLTMTRPRR
jgi:hypothetical protein